MHKNPKCNAIAQKRCTTKAWKPRNCFLSRSELGENVRENDDASLVEHPDTEDLSDRNHQSASGCDVNPHGEQGDGEEVVEQHERLANDAGEKTNRAIDAVTAEFEVLETACLQGF